MSKSSTRYRHAFRATVCQVSFKIFYTRQNMRPGYSYDTMIRRYLKSCRTILICWSPSAVTSDYVNAEAEYGRTNKRLVACKVLECELMPPFNTFQTADLTTWNGEDEHPTWRALVALLQHRKSGTIEPYREPTARASPPELSRRQKFFIGAAIIAALLIGVAIGFFWHLG